MLKPVYDHSTGSLVRPEYVEPREFVIVEGLLGFHTPAMRQFYDVKVFSILLKTCGVFGRSNGTPPSVVRT